MVDLLDDLAQDTEKPQKHGVESSRVLNECKMRDLLKIVRSREAR
jgi:hypothetical protein